MCLIRKSRVIKIKLKNLRTARYIRLSDDFSPSGSHEPVSVKW